MVLNEIITYVTADRLILRIISNRHNTTALDPDDFQEHAF